MLFRKTPRKLGNILIVEDEPLVAFENELRIADAGFTVAATVDTVEEAVAVIERGDVQLVMADVHLSNGGSGTDVARVAHEAGIPVLYVTGACPDEARKYAIGCLIKPYSERDLVRAIEAVDELLQGRSPKAPPPVLRLYGQPA